MVAGSVALSWVLPGEDSERVLPLRDAALQEGGAVLLVPPAVWSEVANALWVAVRRLRLERDAAVDALKCLVEFGFEAGWSIRSAVWAWLSTAVFRCTMRHTWR